MENRRRLTEPPRAGTADLSDTADLDLPAADHHDTRRDARRDRRRAIGPDDYAGGLAAIGLADEDDDELTDEPDYADYPDYEAQPIAQPISEPIALPIATPTALPIAAPTALPIVEPIVLPTALPTALPIAEPIARPTAMQTALPTFAEPIAESIPELAHEGSEVDGFGEADPAADPQPIEESAPIIPSHRPPPAEPVADLTAPPHPVAVTPGDEESRPISVRRVDRSDRRYGDRVDGWVRPEYHDAPIEPPSGEYWTPIPMDDMGFDMAEDDPEPSSKGYGWPIPVERLPAVPDYEPATGFDLAPVATEPTEVVPVWPPVSEDRRIRLPRSWSSRNEKPADNRFLEPDPAPRRHKTHDDADQRFRAPTGEPERRRPRPRPRPGPGPDNVYVSRHAADPPR